MRDLGAQYGVPVRHTELAQINNLMYRVNDIYNELEYAHATTYQPMWIMGEVGSALDGTGTIFTYSRNALGGLASYGPTAHTGIPLGHYSRFVKSGMARVATSSADNGIRIHAFVNQGNLALVMINNKASGESASIKVTGAALRTHLKAEQTTGASSYWKSVAATVSPGPGTITVTVPAQSITSLLVATQ